MSLSLKQLKGRWVASLADGRILGSVQGVFLDPAGIRLKGVSLKPGRFADTGEDPWISVETIRKIGFDLIYLPDEKSIQSQPAGLRALDDLLGKPISSKDGQSLGTLADIEVDNKHWGTAHLRIGADLVLDVDQDELVMGEDLILVQAQVKTRKKSMPPSRQELIYSNLREEFLKQTSRAVQHGEALVKQTSRAMRRILQGSEAELKPRPAGPSPATARSQSSGKKKPAPRTRKKAPARPGKKTGANTSRPTGKAASKKRK